MAYTLIQAKPISYGGTRALSDVRYIVIHYTAGNGDTALAECKYFQNGNTRSAGAHFFVDRAGTCYQSIPLNRTAWSVGGFYTKANGAGTYYNVCTNFNSVSIELCDILTKPMSSAQVIATRDVVNYIRSQCPNAKTIIRHWDVNGKLCPARMAGTNNAEWNNLIRQLPSGTPAPVSTSFKVQIVSKRLHVREKARKTSKHVMWIYKGEIYTIVKTNTKKTWGKLKSGAGWISLSSKYVKRV